MLSSDKIQNVREFILLTWNQYSLGRAGVKLRHAKGKIADIAVYACALLSAHIDTHGTKGKKGMVSRISKQANEQCTLTWMQTIIQMLLMPFYK